MYLHIMVFNAGKVKLCQFTYHLLLYNTSQENASLFLGILEIRVMKIGPDYPHKKEILTESPGWDILYGENKSGRKQRLSYRARDSKNRKLKGETLWD